ncbi:MAG: 30S ribosomal protein S17 [Candidatus Marinimicrobia bacterium]|nr:30S ribosomal protein S17 [Candidatus Neomarinimicrobiota bacterium]
MAAAKSNRRRLTGEVIKTAMDKTAVVRVTRRFPHPMYKKYITRTKNYYVHDEQNSANPGDKVIIEETRPISKLKRWRLLDVTTPASGGSA